MQITDIVVLILILAILGAAACFVYRAKKKGKTCIGCSCGGNCSDCKR